MKLSLNQWAAISAIVAILFLGFSVLKSNRKIKDQMMQIDQAQNEISRLNNEISGLVLSNQAEQLDALEEVATIETQCAEKIKNAVAGAKVPPREKVVFQTKKEIEYVEAQPLPSALPTPSPSLGKEKSCPDSDYIAAFGLRDIQTAGDN